MKKPIYIIVEAMGYEGEEAHYEMRGAYLDEQKAHDCCDILNEQLEADYKFANDLVNLGYYSQAEVMYDYDQYLVEELDIYDWDITKSMKKSKEEIAKQWQMDIPKEEQNSEDSAVTNNEAVEDIKEDEGD